MLIIIQYPETVFNILSNLIKVLLIKLLNPNSFLIDHR